MPLKITNIATQDARENRRAGQFSSVVCELWRQYKSHASISSEGLSRQEEEEEEVASSSTDCKRHLSGGLAVLLNQVRAGCVASR